MSEDLRQPAVTLHTALEDAIRYFRRESLDYRNPNGACARRMDKSVRRSLAASCDERARIIGLHLAALTSSQDGWRPIETAEQTINNEILGLGVYMGKAVRFVCVWNGAEWYAGWGNAIQPTLWMPLPPPPVKDMGL